MEKLGRVLPDWLTNLSSSKHPKKAERNTANKTVRNGRKPEIHACGSETKRNIDVAMDSKTDSTSIKINKTVSVKVACASPVGNAALKREKHIQFSSSEEEEEDSSQQAVLNVVESHESNIKKKDLLSEQLSLVCNNSEPLQITENIMKEMPIEKPSELNDNAEPMSISNDIDPSNEVYEDSGSCMSPSIVDNVSDLNGSQSADIDETVNQPKPTTNNNAGSNSVRSSCKYGNKCYRKNPQHLQDFSHPGDADYSTVDNRLECKFGTSCYRKNPLHRQHYKHTKKVQMPRKAKRPKKNSNDNDDSLSDDDYDLDDPFLNDASSDDFEPESSDSDTDFSGADSKAGSDEDVKQLQKEARRMQRKRKH